MSVAQEKNKKRAMLMTALLLPATGLFFLLTLRIAVTAWFDSQLSHNFLTGSHLFPLILLAACISVLLVLLGFSLDSSSAVVAAQLAPHRPVNLHLTAPWYVKLGFYVMRLLASVYFEVVMQTGNLLVFAFPEARHLWFNEAFFVVALIAYAIISA